MTAPATYLLDRPVHGPGVETIASWAPMRRDARPGTWKAVVRHLAAELLEEAASEGRVVLGGPTVQSFEGHAALGTGYRFVVLVEVLTLDRYWAGRPWPTLDLYPRLTRLLRRLKRGPS